MTASTSSGLYTNPFSRAYWRDAAAELKDLRMLIFAALMIALRVIFKAVRIPVGPFLEINTAFLINALGAMSFGPVVAVIAAAITDTLGAILFPSGPYFFPFILTEIAGSLIFALFLYRAKITTLRVLLARFCVVFFVNLVIQTPIMAMYYRIVLGKSYAWIDLPRIVKNLTLFPLESLVLVVFLNAVMRPLGRLGVIRSQPGDLRLTKKTVLTLVCLNLFSAAAFGGASVYLHNTTSLSASYTTEERAAANLSSLERIREQDPELPAQDVVAVVESAYTPFLSSQTTWNVAVYQVNPEELAAKPADFGGFDAYSKSKAAADPALTRLYTAVVVTDGEGRTISFAKQEPAGT